MSMLIMVTTMVIAMVVVITTAPVTAVVITITTAISVGKDVAIATDVGMVLVVVSVAVVKTVLMTFIVYCQDQDGSRMTKIPLDNNRSNYFSYNSQIKIFSFGIYTK